MHEGQFGEIGNYTHKTQHIHDAGKPNVVGAIRMASARTGVDFAYLLNKADQESGLNPSAKASTSSATGLFQFVKQTWLQMVKEHGKDYGLGDEADAIIMKDGKLAVSDKAAREKILNLRHDPVLNAAMAAEYTRENKDYLDAKVGGRIGSTELYLAHFLGAGGAASFIKNMRASPNAEAADVLPDAADSNPSVFYNKSGRALSFKEIYHRFAAKFNNHDTSRFAQDDDSAPASNSVVAVNNNDNKVWFDLPKRDMAELSPSLYVAPVDKTASTPAVPAAVAAFTRTASFTADTLFNAMIMAQSHINDALKGTQESKIL